MRYYCNGHAIVFSLNRVRYVRVRPNIPASAGSCSDLTHQQLDLGRGNAATVPKGLWTIWNNSTGHNMIAELVFKVYED